MDADDLSAERWAVELAKELDMCFRVALPALLDRLAAAEKAQEVLTRANIAYANEVVTLQAKLKACEKYNHKLETLGFKGDHSKIIDHLNQQLHDREQVVVMQNDAVSRLQAKLAACEVERNRLVQANEGWHTRVSQLRTSNDVYSEKNEQLESRLARAELHIEQAEKAATEGTLPGGFTEDNATLIGEAYRLFHKVAQVQGRVIELEECLYQENERRAQAQRVVAACREWIGEIDFAPIQKQALDAGKERP